MISFGANGHPPEIEGIAGATCPKCNGKIYKGQWIEQNAKGVYEHATCLVIVCRTADPKRQGGDYPARDRWSARRGREHLVPPQAPQTEPHRT